VAPAWTDACCHVVLLQLGTHLRGKRKREELSSLIRKGKK